MARDGNGVFTNPYPDFVAGTVISSTEVDANNSDMATALTQSIAADGQTTITANIPMATFKFTGVGDGSALTDSTSLGQVQAQAYIWCGTMTGTANAGILSPSPAITSYAAGQTFRWKASASANTGAMTIAISGLTTIAAQNGLAALTSGQHAANAIYEGVLDTTSTIQITSVKLGGTGDLVAASNLSDVASASTSRTNLGLGTAAVLNTGVASGDVIKADATGLPVIDGSQLTGISGAGRNINAQTGTTYTLVLTDAGTDVVDSAGKIITMSNASANTLTIPPNSSVAFAVGTQIDIINKGAGVTSVAGGAGVTLNGVSTGTGAINAQYDAVTIIKDATNTWFMVGGHGTVA